MGTADFVVHPNRDAIAPDQPGHNGHYRVLTPGRQSLPEETCRARVMLSAELAHAADDPEGWATFTGTDWLFVTGVVRDFVREYSMATVLPPFGFRTRAGTWNWWDDTTTDHSILEGPDAVEHVRRYLIAQFGDATIELTDLR